jgi:hypothetical protein
MPLSTNLNSHFIKHSNFDLALWATCAFSEADFNEIKSRKTLSRAHNSNTTDGNARLRASLHAKRSDASKRIKNVCFRNVFGMYVFIILTGLGQDRR